MKIPTTFIAFCLLAAGAAVAQSPAPETKPASRAGEAARDSRRDAEEAKTRKQLDEARERLDKAAREVAELSAKLGANVRQDVRVFSGPPRRAVLGIQIDDEPGKQGVRVLGVSPGGPAAEAGLRDRDIIIALDGEPLPDAGAARGLVERMRQVKPDQKVKVRVLRDGKRQDYVVVARPISEDRLFAMPLPMPGRGPEMAMGPMPMVQSFHIWPGEFAGMELASITPTLGAYFGVTEGVLVVSAPKDEAFKLEDGDVLQTIDGRKPDNGPHALRILRSYRAGEKLNLTVLRQRKPVSLAVTMPERPEGGDFFFHSDGAMPPMPAMPGAPPAPLPPDAPGATGRGGTTE